MTLSNSFLNASSQLYGKLTIVLSKKFVWSNDILDKNRLYICDNSIGIEEFCILLTKYITDSKQPSVSPHNKPHVKNTEIVTFFDGKNAINNIFRVSSINPLNIMAVIKSEITVFELKIGKFKT